MAVRLGFDRKIRLHWLDALVDWLLQESEQNLIRSLLHDLLMPAHPGKTARMKTVGVMMRMWALVPPEHRHLRQQALDQLRESTELDRRWFHWGMALMAFPLFRTTAAIVGRLLTVQGNVRIAQVQQRLSEQLGHHSTLQRASQRVISSMVDWGLLNRTGIKGEFERENTVPDAPVAVQLWLVEAVFRATCAEEMEVNQLLSNPMLYPFHLTVRSGEIRRSGRFVVHRQGLDMDILALKNLEDG